MLDTPEAVMARAGIAALPEYEDVASILDAPGFYTFRRYPVGTDLASVITADGRPAVRCYLAFIVKRPPAGSTVSPVILKAWFARRWLTGQPMGRLDTAPSGLPNGPGPASVAVLAKTPKPLDLDSDDDMPGFIYDNVEDVFQDDTGKILTPRQMLEAMYAKHCRTLGRAFRIRWKMGSFGRWTLRQAVWKTQDGAMWILLSFYDVELVDQKKGMLRNPLREYTPADFHRVADKPNERSHFFGFQTSQKSLFTNLSVVVLVCLTLYYKAPHEGLLRAVYGNTALTTAALVFGFLLADIIGPWLLIRAIGWLSRMRDRVLFFIRKVRV
jgi:hypothetical protein